MTLNLAALAVQLSSWNPLIQLTMIKFCLLLGRSRKTNEVRRVEETEKKTGDVGDLQDEEQELENFHVKCTGERS